MSKDDKSYSIDEFNNVGVGAGIDGRPSWKERELSSEYLEGAQRRPGVDVPFLVITLVILLMSLIMMLSASFARSQYLSGEPMRFFIRHLIFIASGISLMILTSRFKLSIMRRWSMHLLLGAVALLVVVLFIGELFNDARRWIGVGELTFQPSEIVKVAVILSFAQMMSKFGPERMKTFKYGVLPFAVIMVVIVALLAQQPHYSAAIIIIALTVIMMFAGGTRVRWFVAAALIAVAAVGLVLITSLRSLPKDEKTQNIAEYVTQIKWGDKLGYAGRRIDAWLDPDADPLRDGFQIRQSLFAVGSGGLLGQGLGQSRQKYLYLPEEINDYIFAVICEELGFIGALLILMLFVLLIVRGYWIALHAANRFSSLVIIGITSLLALQVFFHIAVVTNLIPATGISMPFFSYGGTALWIQLIQIGVVLAASREIPYEKAGKTTD